MSTRSISVDGALQWVSDAAVPVINNGALTADIVLTQVTPAPESTEEASMTTDFGTLTGTVSYPQKIALPDNAIIQVVLSDTSQPNAPAMMLAAQQIPTNGRQVPFNFELTYDAASIVADGRYEVSVTVTTRSSDIFQNSGPIWRSESPVRVISNGVFDVDIALVQVE